MQLTETPKTTYVDRDGSHNVRSDDAGYTSASVGEAEHRASVPRRYVPVVDEERAELEATEAHGQGEENDSLHLVVTVHIPGEHQEDGGYHSTWK